MRSTGGNRFIAHDATRDVFLGAVRDGLRDLERFAGETGRGLDLGQVTGGDEANP